MKLNNTFSWGTPTSRETAYITELAQIPAGIAKGQIEFNLIPGHTYTATSTIFLTADNLIINGNNAKIIRATNTAAENWPTFLILKSDIIINNLHVWGTKTASIDKATFYDQHVGIIVYNAMRPVISNCDFRFFNHSGVVFCSAGNTSSIAGVVLGSADWNQMQARAKLTNNNFSECMIGHANIATYEYSTSSGNGYSQCAAGMYDESGNWFHTGNSGVHCNHPFITTRISLYIKFTHPVIGVISSQTSGAYLVYSNSAHGTINGFSGNHSVDGNTLWAALNTKLANNSAFNFTTYIGANVCGVIGNGTSTKVIPPNITNLTLYYSALVFKLINPPTPGQKWNIINVIGAGRTATKSGVRCDEANLIRVIGFTNFDVNFENTNVEVVYGNTITTFTGSEDVNGDKLE